MCLAIPARIVALDPPLARVALPGSERAIDVSLVEHPAVGDWVLVHAGFAIEKLNPDDARETLGILREMEQALGDYPPA